MAAKNIEKKGNEGRNKHGLLVALVCAIVIIILISFNLYLFDLIPGEVIKSKKYSLTFGGDITFDDGALTFVVDNNKMYPVKYLFIYGLENNSKTRILASHLMDGAHRYLNSTDGTI